MDPHAVNAMGIQGGISMPMSMAMAGVNGVNPQAIAMGINGGMAMNAYGVPQQQQQQQQQQQMMMNMGKMNQINMGSVAMKMNSNTMNPGAPPAATIGPGMQAAGAQNAGADWRIQLTREHRANLIAKIYNEMVRVSADPVPGIKLWMNVSWYELTLYKESRTQEEYINKIFTRLKSLRAQQTDMNAVMAAQALPYQGMLSRLDFSYYNTLNMNQRASVSSANGSQVGGFPGHAQFSGPASHPGTQQPQPGEAMVAGAGAMPTNSAPPDGASTTPRAEKPEGAILGDTPVEYWRQHAALKLKYHDDVEKVHSAFKKYVDHMKGHDETEQKKKLRYLLSYVQLCASILNEDKTTHAPRKIEELDKVYKYIVKIVNPYLKKLRTETDKRSFTPNAVGNPAGMNPSTATNPASNPPASDGAGAASANTMSGPNGAMHMHRQQLGQPQQNLSLQQKQQQYLVQQRAQQMQQQQRMQAQARQQQMMQQQHMMQQQKGLAQQNQAQLSAQQANQANMQKQNGQPQQHPRQNQQQQQLAQKAQRTQQASNGQQRPAQSQQPASQQPQQPRQPSQPPQKTMQQHQQQTHSQQHKIQPPQQQQAPPSAPTSRAEASSLSLEDPLYGGMDSSTLLLMPSNLGPSGSSSGFVNFPNDLSPTNFSSMDLLDMDGFMGHDGSSSGSGSSGQNNSNSSGGNNTSSGDSDLMFMEAL